MNGSENSHLMRKLNQYDQRPYKVHYTKAQKRLMTIAFDAGREYERGLQQALFAEAMKQK